MNRGGRFVTYGDGLFDDGLCAASNSYSSAKASNSRYSGPFRSNNPAASRRAKAASWSGSFGSFELSRSIIINNDK